MAPARNFITVSLLFKNTVFWSQAHDVVVAPTQRGLNSQQSPRLLSVTYTLRASFSLSGSCHRYSALTLVIHGGGPMCGHEHLCYRGQTVGRSQLWALGKFPRGCGSVTKCVGSGPSPITHH